MPGTLLLNCPGDALVLETGCTQSRICSSPFLTSRLARPRYASFSRRSKSDRHVPFPLSQRRPQCNPHVDSKS